VSVREHHARVPARVRVAVITVSDTRTPADDESGALLCDLLRRAGHEASAPVLVRDDRDAIVKALEAALASPAQAVVLNGGTGISPRDVTLEAVRPLLDKELPGFGELFRARSFLTIGSAAMLSRALAGVARRKVVVALPGSPAAVRLAMEELLLPELPHMVAEAVKGTGAEGDPLVRGPA